MEQGSVGVTAFVKYCYLLLLQDLHGVYSARAFVGWYNGLPTHRDVGADYSHDICLITRLSWRMVVRHMLG